MSWVRAIPCDEVQNGPDEGYLLSEGVVDDKCQLTCDWHNWKFRLRDGACIEP
jgi:nitrite reductase/ring-hydroxylating ferredoxin subunit